MPTVNVKVGLHNPFPARRAARHYRAGQGNAARMLLGQRPYRVPSRVKTSPHYQQGMTKVLKQYKRETNPAFYKAQVKRTTKKAYRATRSTITRHANTTRRRANSLVHTRMSLHPTTLGYAVLGGVAIGGVAAAAGYAAHRRHKRTVVPRHSGGRRGGDKHRDGHGRFA